MSRRAVFTLVVAAVLAVVPFAMGCGNNGDATAQTDCPQCELCELVLEGCQQLGPLPLKPLVPDVAGHDVVAAQNLLNQIPPIVNNALLGLPPDPFTQFWLDHVALALNTLALGDFKMALEAVQAFICDIILIADFIAQQQGPAAANNFLDMIVPIIPPLIAAIPPPPIINPPPPPPPAPMCGVDLLVEDGGALRDPGQRAFINPGEVLRFQAVVTAGLPGGTFAYELTAGAGQTNFGLASSTTTGNAGFMALNFPGSYTVKVTYTAPDGAVCEDTIEIVMQCS